MQDATQYEVLVMGIGNILWADEGFGVRAVERYHEKFADDCRVRVIDGGTLGAYLINEVINARRLLIFDCCDLKAASGTMRLLRGDEIKIWSATKISPHQTGMNDVLATAMLRGYEPEKLTVIGVQPKELEDYGGSLTETVKAAIEPAVDCAAKELADWGFAPKLRSPGSEVSTLGDETLEMSTYESERPDEEAACRTGDSRFFRRSGSCV